MNTPAVPQKQVSISYDEFLEKYKPVKNHIDTNASYDGQMFETYGAELEHVRAVCRQDESKVWTIIDSDEEDNTVVVSGMHTVNRIGYLVTAVGCEPNTLVTAVDD